MAEVFEGTLASDAASMVGQAQGMSVVLFQGDAVLKGDARVTAVGGNVYGRLYEIQTPRVARRPTTPPPLCKRAATDPWKELSE